MSELQFTNNITTEEALALIETKYWETMSPAEAAKFQLETSHFTLPFDTFHRGIEELLGRPVFTHEIAMNFGGLQAEARGDHPAPTLQEILDLIPEEKRIVVYTDAGT